MDSLIQQFIDDQLRQSYEVKKKLLEDTNLTSLIKEVAKNVWKYTNEEIKP
jgi:hypothetical protein